MSITSIENGLEREEDILRERLSNGEINISEYNNAMRQLQREAREYAREEVEQDYQDYYHN